MKITYHNKTSTRTTLEDIIKSINSPQRDSPPLVTVWTKEGKWAEVALCYQSRIDLWSGGTSLM